jgi:transcriptional regulator with XRE-family HTH domain/outer membrane biosynthesis protein TonB
MTRGLVRIGTGLILGLSFVFAQAADAAGAEQQVDAALGSESGAPETPVPPPEQEPTPEPTAPPDDEPPLTVTADPPEQEPAPEPSAPPSDEPAPIETIGPPEQEPAPEPTAPPEDEPLPSEAAGTPEEPLPTEPSEPSETTGEESAQSHADPAASPEPTAGADQSTGKGSGTSLDNGPAQPASTVLDYHEVSQPPTGVGEAMSPSSSGATDSAPSGDRPGPRTTPPAPLALALDQPSSMRVDTDRCSFRGIEDCADVISASAASVIALAPRIPTSVSVAVEFGKAGHGWAGVIVFNLWLRRQLRERRMSQRQLAHLSGVNHSTISRLLAGDRTPSLDTATKIARALRVPNEDFATELGFVEGRPAMPTQRVEAALRGDEDLNDIDVRELMEEYIARRRRLNMRAVDSRTAVRGSPATSGHDPPA